MICFVLFESDANPHGVACTAYQEGVRRFDWGDEDAGTDGGAQRSGVCRRVRYGAARRLVGDLRGLEGYVYWERPDNVTDSYIYGCGYVSVEL